LSAVKGWADSQYFGDYSRANVPSRR